MDKIQELFAVSSKEIPMHTTGFAELDLLTSGLPQGRIIDFYGHEGVGKTLIGLDLAKHICDQDLLGCYIDMNFGVDIKMLEDRGICLEKLYFAQPSNGDTGLSIVIDILESGICDFMIIDSTAGFAPELKTFNDEVNYSKFMSNALAKIQDLALKYNCTVLFLNEYRTGLDGKQMTLGTSSLTYEAALRAEIIAEEEGIYLDITKNKTSKKFGKVKLYGLGD